MTTNNNNINDVARLAVVESRLERMEQTLESIAQSLQLLTRVDMRVDLLEKNQSLLDSRVRVLEQAEPKHTLATDGFLGMAKHALTAILGAVLAVVIAQKLKP
jgi:Asp-tRNA(Asn)/Glu-tRNA(Gln) amidotransferase C subunit